MAGAGLGRRVVVWERLSSYNYILVELAKNGSVYKKSSNFLLFLMKILQKLPMNFWDFKYNTSNLDGRTINM